MMIRIYAVLEVSEGTFVEIHTALKEAGYSQSFDTDHTTTPPTVTIDMHGIALKMKDDPDKRLPQSLRRDLESLNHVIKELRSVLEGIREMTRR